MQEMQETQEQQQESVFKIEGQYTKVIKEMFSCLAKSAEKSSDFHILVNMAQIAFIIKARGNITSTVLSLKEKFFTQDLIFNENHSNTASGFVLKVNLDDFDLCYKLLDPGPENKIYLNYVLGEGFLEIQQYQQIHQEDIITQTTKSIKLAVEDESQEERDAISISFLPDMIQYPISLEFPSGNVFKLVEKCFGSLKLDNLIFSFEFKDSSQNKFSIESDQDSDDEVFRVNLNKFKKIKCQYDQVKYSYASKLVLPAFSFFSKETEITLNIGDNGTLYIISEDSTANCKTETVIPTNIDISN